jgi:hypothetical protein
VRRRDQPVEKLLRVPSEIPSRARRPALAAFEPRFGSVRILFWAVDRSDNDFFNRLTPSTHSGE